VNPGTSADRLGKVAVNKVFRHLIPLLFLLYILNFLDRVNVGFAALSMNQDLNFGPAVYGLGAGIFFAGYCLFEVPSNLVLYRIGARVWIARIMVTWGLVASAMILVRTSTGFYGLRFLLGVAEAGFFPGIIFYLTYWYPARERARAYAWFLAAIPICGVVGGPISGALLGLDGWLGMRGWQWLFLLEGIPSVVVGVMVLWLLPDRPSTAKWLTREEAEWLEVTIDAERGGKESEHSHQLGKVLANPMVWALGLCYFLLIAPLYGFALWLPQLLKASAAFTNFEVGVITAIPYSIAAIGMILNGRHSDSTGERYLHMVVPALVAVLGFWTVTMSGSTVALVAALSLTAFGVLGWLGPFWSLPTAFLKEQGSAGGVALINSLGAVGGFVGPYVIGKLKEQSGSYSDGLLLLGASSAAAVVLVMLLRRWTPARAED
jgi:ACS family tartrate transporter-like MFS transporter